MSSTLIGIIVLVVGVIISALMTPKREIKDPSTGRVRDVYDGDREF